MTFNKDFITRLVIGLLFFIIFLKVVGPVILEALKEFFRSKIPGSVSPDHDIDSMIRRQKERLRAQYGLNDRGPTSVTPPPPSKEIEGIYKESHWGGGSFAKSIQNEISKNYGYTLAETKVNAFVMLAEKRNYLNFLNPENQRTPESIRHFLSLVMLFLIMVEEIRTKDFSVLEKIAKKCQADKTQFLLAIQLKVLTALSSRRPIKDERLFDSSPTLHQYAEDSMKEALEIILAKEANLWARGHSLFFEELSLYLNYASFLLPTPELQNRSDVRGAFAILNIPEDTTTEEIKKVYKKFAMDMHPDRIGQMNLPKLLEKKAIHKFGQIQNAYDIIMNGRKK